MKVLRGVPASPGVAVGAWVRIEPPELPEGATVGQAEAEGELDRLRAASEAAATALEGLAASVSASGAPDEAAIFEAQSAMARDPMLLDMARDRIGTGLDAVGAIRVAVDEVAGQLAGLDDPLLAARATDVRDVGARLVEHLVPSTADGPGLDEPAIVVARDLAPSLTAALPRDRLLGIALEGGSPSAHAAILARAYGIPAVVGLPDLLATLETAGDGRLAIDGSAGRVVLDPDASTLRDLGRQAEQERRRARMALDEAGLPAVTRDGALVTLVANIGLPSESARARDLGARGVGLFRTEFLFSERPHPPSEDEQVGAYRTVIDAFAPDPVVIRLLDVGGDKPIPFLRLPAEANPFLGVRALRIAETQPELFVTQLRAAMRAAADSAPGAVKVMAPMVADGADVDLLLRLADEARTGLAADGLDHGDVSLGVMLEIPSAVLTGAGWFDRIAFASLGTNDLTQYTLAADRGNARLGRFHDALHPAVLGLVRMSVDAAERAGIELSVCGESAGDPAAALALVGLGIRRLSMVAGSLAPVRHAIRSVSLEASEAAAAWALDAPHAAAVRARFEGLARQSG